MNVRGRSRPNPLAMSLELLRAASNDGERSVIKSSELSRTHRERLKRAGFVEEIIRGWLAINGKPGANTRIRENWSTIYWEFVSAYLNDRFGEEWSLSPEHSIRVHTGNLSLPEYLVVRSPHGDNASLKLPQSMSIFVYRAEVPASSLAHPEIFGLRLMGIEDALSNLSPSGWKAAEIDVASALSSTRGTNGILHELLPESRSLVAGRIAGALRSLGRDKDADDIKKAMTAVNLAIREASPFGQDFSAPAYLKSARTGPVGNRIRLMWDHMRRDLEQLQIPTLGMEQTNPTAFADDALNSLLIEGYRVDREMVVAVTAEDWSRSDHAGSPDALAARGYWLAYQVIQKDIAALKSGEADLSILRNRHLEWHRLLFAATMEAGNRLKWSSQTYRSKPIYLRRSKHIPLQAAAVEEAMDILFDCVETTDSAVSSIIAPFMLTYIHPFIDGNGRTARFLMNALRAKVGLSWAIVPYSGASRYLSCLETASIDLDIKPLARFLSET